MFKRVGVAVIVLTCLCLMAFNVVLKGDKNDLEEGIVDFEQYEPIVVLELFTSQGCSSCPAADLLLENVKEEFQKEVYALSYHVDYWNYIGWEDPFSKPAYSKKQRKYNIKFKNRSNYTPQLVINGKEHFVGSSKAKMQAGIDKYKNEKTANELKLKDVKEQDGSISFKYEVSGLRTNKNIKILVVLDERITSVKRGENRDRTLKNSNIVVAEKIEKINSLGEPSTIRIPKIVEPSEKISLIVLVENDDYSITAAAKIAIKTI